MLTSLVLLLGLTALGLTVLDGARLEQKMARNLHDLERVRDAGEAAALEMMRTATLPVDGETLTRQLVHDDVVVQVTAVHAARTDIGPGELAPITGVQWRHYRLIADVQSASGARSSSVHGFAIAEEVDAGQEPAPTNEDTSTGDPIVGGEAPAVEFIPTYWVELEP